jgi:malic enzyme
MRPTRSAPIGPDKVARASRSREAPATRDLPHGHAILAQPLLNKETAFSPEEREALGLRGLLPPGVMTIDQQVRLELEHVRRKADDLERYIGLAALQDRNETLFYRVLTENLEEFLPIVYTPTVGRACQEFSHILRRSRGVWLTPDDVDRMDTILREAARGDVRLIVVTDNERILGLGDQGAGGMAIPIGKLALYTAAAGVHPAATLPVSLDVGTDRPELLADPLYLGHRAPRLRGAAYDRVVDAFVEAVGRVFPAAIVQWEDFKQHIALAILERYRHRLPSFNDDVQGTGAVVLGGLLAARGGPAGLHRDRILILGAGAAAIGVATMVRHELPSGGPSADPTIVLVDRRGLVHTGRADLAADQRPFAVDSAWLERARLSEDDAADPVAIARAVGATILVGTTGCAGAFGEPLVREVATHSPRPIVLPLSNPSDRSEAAPADVLAWTAGRAIVATGSPSGPVVLGGRRWTIGQANNVFIFPGVGLAAIVTGAREVPDDAFVVAAHALARATSQARRSAGSIYPPIRDLRRVARTIAVAVACWLVTNGWAWRVPVEGIERAVDAAMWVPDYAPLTSPSGR